MRRMVSALGLAFLVCWLARPLGAQQPKRPEIYVILKATVYEVDDAYYRRLVKASKWKSKAELGELEQQALNQPQNSSLFKDLFDKQKLLRDGKEVNLVNPDDEALLLALTREVKCLASPEDLQRGRSDPQTFQEGVSFRAKAQISADRRFVIVSFAEKSLEVEGTEKVTVAVAEKGAEKGAEKEATGEVAFLQKGTLSQVRTTPDGGSLLLPIQYRPRETRARNRWLVAVVTPRIYIEAEERLRKGMRE